MTGNGLFSILSIGVVISATTEALERNTCSRRLLHFKGERVKDITEPCAKAILSSLLILGNNGGGQRRTWGSWAIMEIVSATQRTRQFGHGVGFGKNVEIRMESFCSIRRYGWQMMKWL